MGDTQNHQVVLLLFSLVVTRQKPWAGGRRAKPTSGFHQWQETAIGEIKPIQSRLSLQLPSCKLFSSGCNREGGKVNRKDLGSKRLNRSMSTGSWYQYGQTRRPLAQLLKRPRVSRIMCILPRQQLCSIFFGCSSFFYVLLVHFSLQTSHLTLTESAAVKVH